MVLACTWHRPLHTDAVVVSCGLFSRVLRHGAVCVQESYEHVREWLKEVERYAAPETCKLLIGNKSDRTDRAVSEPEGTALSKELGMPFLETSARTADNVEAAFVKMAEQLIQMRYVCTHHPTVVESI